MTKLGFQQRVVAFQKIPAQPPSHYRIVVAIVVVHYPQHIIGIFTGEAEGVVGTEIISVRGRVACRDGESTKGSVFVMRGNAESAGEEKQVGDVLVTIVDVIP